MAKRILSMTLAIVMLMSLIPEGIFTAYAATPALHQGEITVMENTNQGDGVVLTKYAVPHTDQNGVPDGTVDIVLQAYTSGRVVQTSTTTPADIVLVLDLSGSMEDRQGSTTLTNYTPVYAEEDYYTFGGNIYYYTVGLGTSSTRYVKIGDRYVAARRNSTDSQGFEVWRYTDGGSTVSFYPALASGETTLRAPQHSYPTLQVYRQSTTTVQGEKKIDILKEAVDSFIDHTAESNAGIANDADKHRVALVKFASAEYYNTGNLIAEGDHKNRDNYNYSEVVKGFTTVNTAGATALKDAMNAMTSGGATAVDYGINLAIKLFEAQDEATESQRNKIVIVFTDGSPTHANSYQASVAGSAINYAKTLKDEGVTVYTLSVENGADGSQLGGSNSNRFMHYVSSNYPEASYSGGNIVEGSGEASRGYYLTPDTSHSLEMLFEAISSEIGAPTISMGTESVLTDTVSEYFEVAGGINGVAVYTSLRNGDGTWAPAAVDTSLIPVVDGNIVSVKGFEFDEHYISEQPRRIGGDDYYGKALILSINVTPDYPKIDAEGAVFGVSGDAKIHTNYGNAQLTNGVSVVAEVASPTVAVNTVTYKVDGADYKTFYRFAGASVTPIAAPTKTGATFGGWMSSDVNTSAAYFVMPQKDVVIEGAFTDIDYTVSYQYVGAEIPGRPALPASHTHNYGDSVTAAPVPTLAGYEFVGWYPQDEALGSGSLTTFSMPAHNVLLLGRFIAKNDVAYKVEHYTENLDGSWKLEDTEPFSGTTGETVYAVQKTYPGFTFDSSVPGTVEQGVIAGDGSLTLKLYYTRNSYEITYEYVGTVPGSAAPAASGLNAYTASYKFGETVLVKPDASAVGYTFHGWYSSGGTVTEDMTEFVMPAQAVRMRGYFVAKSDTVYMVEHYFENINDSNYTIDNAKTETFHALTDSSVSAKPLNVQGFTHDSTDPVNVLSGVVAGDGSLVLKVYYKRNLYKVSYTYEGTVPTTADPTAAVLATYEASYKFGAPVTVKAAASALNHTFHGWHYANEDTHTVVTAFDMPAHDVHLSGHFTRVSDPGYTVLHFFEKLDGSYDRANPDITQEFKGAHGETVTAQRAYQEGFTYDETNPNTKKSGVVLDGQELTLELYYTRNSYTVTYDYSGAIPADATPSKAGLASYTATYKHGETVVIAGASTASGYTFNGWFSTGGTVVAGDVSFVMPMRDVELRGYFVALSGTKYRIEHYFENIAGTDFVLDSTKTETLTGITGDKAQAKALAIAGFTFDSTNANNLLEGLIAGDGSLVLKVYYKRNLYTVTYTYTGTVPTTADPTAAVLTTYEAQYRFGAPVTVKGAANAVNHTFHGWHYASDNTHAVVTAFDMPAHDVHLSGHFIRVSDPGYTVEHYFEKLDGTFDTANPDKTQSLKAAHGITVVAERLYETGFTLDETVPGTVKSGVVRDGESLTLKLFYKRNVYKVIYEYEGAVPANPTPTAAELAAAPYTVDVKFGATVNIQPQAGAAGYSFHGWYYNDNGTHTVVSGSFEMPAQNVELFGEFAANTDTKYTVEHYFENTAGVHVIDSSKTQIFADGVTGAEVTAHPITVGGFVYNSVMSAATRSGVVEPDGSLTLKLYYDRVAYTVTYSFTSAPAGAVPPAPQTDIAHGTTVNVQSAPVVAGYTFSGWSMNGTPVTSDTFTMPEANVTLIGHYTVNGYSYVVEHYVENGSGYILHGAPESRQANYGADVTASAIDIHGFRYNADRTETQNSGKTFTDASKTVLKTKIVDGTTVFSFYYDKEEYTVTYVIGGTVIPQGVSAPAAQTVKFGDSVDVQVGFSVAGYVFSGWSTDDVTYSGTSFVMPAKNVTFTGTFGMTSVSYTVRYWQQTLDGAGTKDWKGNNYAEVIADRYTGTAVVDHYVNALSSHGRSYTGFALSPVNDEYTGTVTGDGSLELNLYYDRLSYNVTYHYAGVQPADAPAIPASYNQIAVPFGTVVTVESKMPDYSNRTFDGWHGANVNIVGKTDFEMPAHDVTIFGSYVPLNPDDFKVTYYVDGTVYRTEIVKPGQVHDIIDAPVRQGYVFSGWSDPVNQETGLTVDYSNNFIMPWADVEIHGFFTSTYRPTQLLLDKQLNAPDGFDRSRQFTFEIYSTDDLTTPVATAIVYGGSVGIIQLEPGTYKLVEKNAHVDGYKLEYTCSASDGLFTIYDRESTRVVCTNTYTEVALDRSNHFGYIVGYPDGTVRPESNITRAEAATIFFRMLTDESRQSVYADTNDFTDVSAEDWFNNAISTLRNAEILAGEETEFRPNEPITRAELVAIATAFYDSEVGDECAFSDIKGHWAEKFINEAYNLGIIEGYPDGTFHPDDLITRAEAIAVVNRTLDRHPHAEHLASPMILWPDNADTTKWYYAHVQEATNSHTYYVSNGVEVWIDTTPIRDWAALEAKWREDSDED